MPLTGILPLDWSFLESIANNYFLDSDPYELAAALKVPKEFIDSQFECAYSPESTLDFLKEWNYLYGDGTSGEVLRKALSRIGLSFLSDKLESTHSFLKGWTFLYGRHGTSGGMLQKALSRIGLHFLSDKLEKKFDNSQGKERIISLD